MARQIIGLDIGSYSIKVARLQARGQKATDWVYDFDEQIIEKKESDDPSQGKAAIALALEALKARGKLSADFVVSALPGSSAQIRFLEVPFAQVKKINAVFTGILESQLPFSIENMLCPWTFAAAQSKDNNAQTRILAGLCPKSVVQEHLALLEPFHLSPRILDFKALALSSLVMQGEYEQASVLIVDLGQESTSISIIKEQKVVLARVINRGISESTAQESALLSDIRQSLQVAKAQNACVVERCFLVGGGAKINGISQKFQENFELPVQIPAQLLAGNLGKAYDPKFALAMCLAQQALNPNVRLDRLNFRSGEFSYRSKQGILKSRMPTLATWTVLFSLCLLGNYCTQKVILSQETAKVVAEQKKLCDTIVKGKSLAPSKCVAIMREQLANKKGAGASDFSAIDPYLEIAKVLSRDLSLKVTDLTISEENIDLQATTSNFESVDKIVAALKKGSCFSKVEKGKATTLNDSVSFSVAIVLGCKNSAKEGV